ncbi:hypothetical protein IJ541_03645 [bacterium]|nr:hypothetical protein [bacterium]
MSGKEPIMYKNFGGVDFNWNQVKSAKVKNVNGQKMYYIEFKSGVTAEYPEQSGDASMRSRELTMWQSFDYDTETILNGVQNAKVKGSKKDDHIIGKEVQNCEIDVSGDNNDDHVDIESKYRTTKFNKKHGGYTDRSAKRSSDNKIILDKNDSATRTYEYKEKIQQPDGKFKENLAVQKREVNGPGVDTTM